MSTIIDQIQQRHKKSSLSKKETAKELNISEATLRGGVFFAINKITSYIGE